jgi:hypothetical protein
MRSLAYLYQATPDTLPPKMDLNRLSLSKENENGLLGPRYVNTFFARLFSLFHDTVGTLHFGGARDALRFFSGNFPACMSLHIGFSTRVTPLSHEEVDFDEPNPEPEEEGGDGFDTGNASEFYPHYHYPVVSKYLPAVEALICHPLVVPVIEAGRADVEPGQNVTLNGPEEWTAETISPHLEEICIACGVADPDMRRRAVLDALGVFITSDSKEVIGYVDVDIPPDWEPPEESKEEQN